MSALPPLRHLFLALMLSLSPLAAAAHPHVYIDAALGLIHDAQGRLTAVEVEWAYDELYSLLIIEDMGLDPDGDGLLAGDELAQLQGFDADWEPGFDGRLYLAAEARRVVLDAPQGFTAEYRDGRIVSRHLRPLAQPLPAGMPLTAQVYDPEFYVDFTLTDATRFEGRGDCRAALDPGDPAAAPDAYRAAVEAALAEADGTVDEEFLVVDIGAAGADLLRLACGAGGAEG